MSKSHSSATRGISISKNNMFHSSARLAIRDREEISPRVPDSSSGGMRQAAAGALGSVISGEVRVAYAAGF